MFFSTTGAHLPNAEEQEQEQEQEGVCRDGTGKRKSQSFSVEAITTLALS
jgi:hypothetical protein